MPIPDNHRGIPELPLGEASGAQILWQKRSFDPEYGTIFWNQKRYWFSFSCYDHDEEVVHYSVFEISPEEAGILDDWYMLFSTLTNQYRALANDPLMASSAALREKSIQLKAFENTLPRFESTPVVARFSISDHGLT